MRVGDVYHGSRMATAEALVAGYMSDVKRWFAPSQLLGREDELSRLRAFCAGAQPFLWWQAGPWAGKTGLLASFALQHPADVNVVCYFVRAASAESGFDA